MPEHAVRQRRVEEAHSNFSSQIEVSGLKLHVCHDPNAKDPNRNYCVQQGERARVIDFACFANGCLVSYMPLAHFCRALFTSRVHSDGGASPPFGVV